MENLIKKLETEVGLTNEQALKAIKVFQEYMKDNDLTIDWGDFLKAKSEKVSEATQKAFGQLFGDDDWFEKASKNLDSFTDKAKQKINEARNAAADFLATDDKE